MSSPQDRRQYPRFSSGRLGFVSIGGDTHQAQMRDLAEGGICFEVGFPLDPGLQTLIELSPGRRDVQEPVRLPIRVVWCTAAGTGYQVGGKFEALEPPLQERLAFILADLAGDTPRSYRRPLTRVAPDDPDPHDE